MKKLGNIPRWLRWGVGGAVLIIVVWIGLESAVSFLERCDDSNPCPLRSIPVLWQFFELLVLMAQIFFTPIIWIFHSQNMLYDDIHTYMPLYTLVGFLGGATIGWIKDIPKKSANDPKL